ncbi:hypothetical protein SARC_10343 [Sphaeroforma arctica JP610]|uniref:Uncharacterized protein n=1 Tax=Sphaeroforma arctica JP610 TaxID=667725 RepID=A0A0L0FKA9_9EUKA|nr:hypothetical protein SARC_10343 [Sphaeroforma arctica JP610]KNC77190.1 hypothetical protein SARC_10343 [Sphaeroforma arctica JP610]|eukprot:XP_014151092.1 hypothetical protein SARC_10343 [Sphaeroforma arctica JP610]
MSLFADGSGAFVVAPEGQWRIRQAGCNLVPDTKHLLGMRPQVYGQPYRSCYTMTLHWDVPSALGEYMDSGNGAELLEKVLGDHAIQEQLPALAVHPGGPAILTRCSLRTTSSP